MKASLIWQVNKLEYGCNRVDRKKDSFDIDRDENAIIRSDTDLHLPMEHRAIGSPTTATRDWARVIAVFNSLTLERKP